MEGAVTYVSGVRHYKKLVRNTKKKGMQHREPSEFIRKENNFSQCCYLGTQYMIYMCKREKAMIKLLLLINKKQISHGVENLLV
jgi:hypothetical protein